MPTNRWTAAQMASQEGKTALITGANSGIGYQAAVELARHGAHVVMGVRNPQRVRRRWRGCGRKLRGRRAEVGVVDMASLGSIRRFAEGFERPLDVLVNNAGVMALPERELTEDGFERQFGTNHLGHFALTGLLMPRLLETAAPRVVTVASLAHRNGKMVWDNLQGERSYVPWDAYNLSKLANLLFARELDRRAREAGAALRSIPVHPGISRTSIVDNGPGQKGLKMLALKVLSPLITQDDAMGALPTLYAATAAEAKGGEYIGPDGFKAFKGWPTVEQPQPQALDEAAGRKLWAVSEELTGVRFPELK